MTLSPTSRLSDQRRDLAPSRVARRVAAVALIVGGGWVFAGAGEPTPEAPLLHTSRKAFTTPDGLPNDSIRVLRAIGNEVWVGTDDGLAMFDGRAWKSWTVSDGLPARRIQCIDRDDSSGDIWIGTFGGGLVRFSAGRFDVFNQFNSGLSGDLVFALTVSDGYVWAATNGGISGFDPITDDWELVNTRRADASFRVPLELPIEKGRFSATPTDSGVRLRDRTLHARNARAGNEAPKPAPPMIGVYGPRTRRITLPGDTSPEGLAGEYFPDLLAVQIATEFSNAGHSARDRRVQLAGAAPGYANYGWGLPEDDLITLADNSAVLGIIAYAPPDGTINETVIDLLELPTVSISREDPKTGHADHGSPYVFQCNGFEPARHRLFLDHLVSDHHCTRLAIVTLIGQESISPACWWTSYARSLKLPTPLEISWDADGFDQLDGVIKALGESDCQAILTWCDAHSASMLLRRLRAAGLTQLFVASPNIMEDAFASTSEAGAVLTMIRSSPIETVGATVTFTRFLHKYAEQSVAGRKQAPPDENARRSFDAADHLLAAVGAAEPNRESMRTTLAAMEHDPFGEVHFERAHGPIDVNIGTLDAGRWGYQKMRTKQPLQPRPENAPQSPERNRP